MKAPLRANIMHEHLTNRFDLLRNKCEKSELLDIYV